MRVFSFDRVIKYLEIFSGILIGALVVLIGVEVFFRYVVGQALSWPEEVCGFVFVWVTMLGAVLCERADSHAAVKVVLNKLHGRLGFSVKVLLQLVVIFYGILMVTQGLKLVSLFGFERSPAAGLRMIWEYMAIPVAGFFLIFVSSIKLIKMVLEETR